MPTTLQLLHASDYEAGIPALDDAVGSALKGGMKKLNQRPGTLEESSLRLLIISSLPYLQGTTCV